jgi:hypothetical protein
VGEAVRECGRFDADSAYAYVEKQVSFGARVPNTSAHRACGDFFVETLRRHGAEVKEQEMEVEAYDGKVLRARNIVGVYGREARRRVLLCAHWDSRPFADQDEDVLRQRRPVEGADDGASGCGVLLEIARQLGQHEAAVGVDIVLFDAEDYGVPEFEKERYGGGGWCLGSQYWAKHPHAKDYRAEYGILLDMVGGRGAVFFKEWASVRRGGKVVEKVWGAARQLGYGRYFVDVEGGAITDDHVYVMEGRGFPCIDIINYDPESATGFGSHWHTDGDNLGVIEKETLGAVGETVLSVVYGEKDW